MRVKTRDDDIIEGADADEIVSQMAESKMSPVKSMAGYRNASARRIKDLFDKDVDPTNSETFVQSMIQNGLLEDLTSES